MKEKEKHNQRMEKIVTYYNSVKSADIKATARDLAMMINTKVIDLLANFGIEITNESIAMAICNHSALIELYKAKHADNETLRSIPEPLREKWLEDLAMGIKSALDRLDRLDIKDYPKIRLFLKFDDTKKEMIVDEKAVNDHCSTILESKQEIEAYKKHKGAAKALNEFFKGKEPGNWFVFFKIKNNLFEPNNDIDINYSLFL